MASNLLQWLSKRGEIADVMADVAHLVRATGCGSVGSGFDPHHSPQKEYATHVVVFSFGIVDV